MNKEAYKAGFEKAGRDMGLDDYQIHKLWNASLNYPEFNKDFQKMSDDKLDMDIETLDTLANLEKLDKLAAQLGIAPNSPLTPDPGPFPPELHFQNNNGPVTRLANGSLAIQGGVDPDGKLQEMILKSTDPGYAAALTQAGDHPVNAMGQSNSSAPIV